jgi:hypothetical protein
MNFSRILGGLGKTAGKAKPAAAAGRSRSLLGSFGTGLAAGMSLFGKLGDEPGGQQQNQTNQNNRAGGGFSSIFSGGASTATNTRVNGPREMKDNCCCCDQTLSLLSSIDESLKRSLYVSQRMALAQSEAAAENAQKPLVAGMGGANEALNDSAEKTGFGIGQTIAQSLALGLATNLGPVLDSFQKEGIDPLNGAIGAIGGLLLGGKKKVSSSIIGGVVGSGAAGEGFYKAQTDLGTGAGIGGMLAGGAAGASIGAVGGPVGSIVLGILGSIAGEDALEALGDGIFGFFNKGVD